MFKHFYIFLPYFKSYIEVIKQKNQIPSEFPMRSSPIQEFGLQLLPPFTEIGYLNIFKNSSN